MKNSKRLDKTNNCQRTTKNIFSYSVQLKLLYFSGMLCLPVHVSRQCPVEIIFFSVRPTNFPYPTISARSRATCSITTAAANSCTSWTSTHLGTWHSWPPSRPLSLAWNGTILDTTLSWPTRMALWKSGPSPIKFLQTRAFQLQAGSVWSKRESPMKFF